MRKKKIFFILNIINQRLNKLMKINEKLKKIIEKSNSINLKPPIFWKDKPNFYSQAKKWDGKIKLKNF